MTTKFHRPGESQKMIKRKFQGIFGTDGIRALAGEEPLTPESARQIGYAVGQVLIKRMKKVQKRIIVGKDTRGSGNWIEEALSEGLSLSGCEVLSCGVIPTSAIAAILQKKNFLGGAVISASHNPSEFNGIKFFSSVGKKIPDLWEKEVEAGLVKNVRWFSSRERFKNSGGLQKSGYLHPYPHAESFYLNFLKSILPPSVSFRNVKWVVDCANGSASHVAAELFRSLGMEVVALHDKPNGININVNCGTLHPESLQKKVVEAGADGGCAFDGDADRVKFVDEKGRMMDGDILLWMAAQHLKNEGRLKNNCVVTTVMANMGFSKLMKEMGVRVVTTPVGDRAVSEALESSGAVLGGEQSGHIIFRDYLLTGDGLLTALNVLNVFRKSQKKLSYFKEAFPEYPQILLNVKVKEKIPIGKLPKVLEQVKKFEHKLDGNGRILVRYSGTEPLLRIMVEGQSKEEIHRIAYSIKNAARNILDPSEL